MFLSERFKGYRDVQEEGTLGTVSVSGERTTVTADGEQSATAMFGPCGMQWLPRRGDSVLVIKAGGAESCIAGVEMEPAADMEPGELRLSSDGASLWLKNDGSICITGRLLVNGKELG